MIYRWLYRAWTVFWTVLGILTLTVLVLGTVVFITIQLPFVKQKLADRAIGNIEDQTELIVEYDEISGIIPFNLLVSDVSVYADTADNRALITTDSVFLKLDAIKLLRNQWLVSELQIVRPQVSISSTQINQLRKRSVAEPSVKVTGDRSSVNVLIPSLRLTNGVIKYEDETSFSDSLTIDRLNAEFFIDFGAEGRYLDIEDLKFNIPELGFNDISLYGQIFNNQHSLELNAFRIRNPDLDFSFRAKADSLQLSGSDLQKEIRSADYTLMVNNLSVSSKILKQWTDYPFENSNVSLSANITGNSDSLSIGTFSAQLGQSSFDMNGYLLNAIETSSQIYELDMYNVIVDTTLLRQFFPDLNTESKKALSGSFISASLIGNMQRMDIDLNVESDRGKVTSRLDIPFDTSDSLTVSSRLEHLNLSNIVGDRIAESDLNGTFYVKVNALSEMLEESGLADLRLDASQINGIEFDSVSIDLNWENSVFRPNFTLEGPVSSINGEGVINLSDSLPSVEMTGSGKNLQIKKLTQLDYLADATVDIDYEWLISGNNRDNLYGQFSLDVPVAIIDGDTLAPHQFYIDFTEPGLSNRTIRLTSTALDLNIEGAIEPVELPGLFRYWRKNLNYRYREEIMLSDDLPVLPVQQELTDQSFSLQATMKSPGLLRSYLPELPYFDSKARFTANVNANGQRILFNSSLQDQEFLSTILDADSLNLQVTGSFRYNEPVKSFSNVNIQTDAALLNIGDFSTEKFSFRMAQSEDSLTFTGQFGKLGDESDAEVDGMVILSATTLQLSVNRFRLGNDEYTWTNKGISSLVYDNNQELSFQDFTFVNEDEFLSFEGTFSEQPEDSVNYIIRNIDLSRISNILDGKISFSGMLDGNFTTRSLTRIPTVQGDVQVTGLALDENVVGDFVLNSSYNTELNRFDTKITVTTDSLKYPEYFVRQGREGQNVELNGYVLAPVNGEFPEVDSLFSFDVDFNNIDLWVIPFIAPKVFSEMSGKGSGKGSLWGNTEDYDFEVNYEVGYDEAVYMKPRFLETYYYAQGPVRFSKQNGLEFDDLFVIDPSGGSAILNGVYDLNNFQEIHDIDLTLEMNEFQFLNNTFDPTIAFFGQAYGSSTIRMTGTNLSPVLSTESPVIISDFSDIGIPLLEETELDEGNKFIRFVSDFSDLFATAENGNSTANQFLNEETQAPSTLTFQERFTLDLQFIAENPMTVQLIFDPVTGDVIRTNGTGRLRIRLEDEELSIFGRFDISGGSYQFVSGDIFTRRFRLEPGGTLIWDGQPDQARLDINAIYQARPDINTLTRARADIDTETSQRIPVELVLNIAGSLNSIQNNFFFRLPDTFETRQNSTIEAQVRALNRNEDEKLIQATSFLLMGDFIPSAAANADATNSLTNNFSGSGAVLNPLLSSQVISPLLSNQINSLLRSDIGSLDIDFNLNTYNNVDLAVALRLYNDRIILSREGQITGAQSNIGDIGATYRINQTFSVTAFHRQDPTFSSLNSNEETQQTQDINGVGLEAQLSFNRWEEFFRKITNPFRKLFGRKEEQNQDLVANDYAPI